MISIIIPNYNYSRFLIETVNSILKQTINDWEIIIVDDKSTDNSAEIYSLLTNRMIKNLRILKNKKNLGVANSRNIGARASNGEYICFLDADDYWEPNKLERQLALFQNSTNHTGVIHTGVKVITDDRTQIWLRDNFEEIQPVLWERHFNDEFKELLFYNKRNYFHVLRKSAPICLSSVMVRRDVFSKVGGFDENLFYQFEDWLFSLKCSLICRINFIPEKLTNYRIHPDFYTGKHYLKQGDHWDLTFGQLYDRCLIFARRMGMELSYKDFRKNYKYSMLTKLLFKLKHIRVSK